MKSWLLSLSYAVCAFVAGIACALFATESLKEKAWQDLQSSMHFWQYDNQDRAALTLHNIKSAENGDVESTIRLNCMILRTSVRQITPEAFAPARQEEVRAFVKEARDTVLRLDGQGLCSFPARSQVE